MLRVFWYFLQFFHKIWAGICQFWSKPPRTGTLKVDKSKTGSSIVGKALSNRGGKIKAIKRIIGCTMTLYFYHDSPGEYERRVGEGCPVCCHNNIACPRWVWWDWGCGGSSMGKWKWHLLGRHPRDLIFEFHWIKMNSVWSRPREHLEYAALDFCQILYSAAFFSL